MILVAATLEVAKVVGGIDLPLAHDLGYPHQEPARPAGGGGGSASTLAIVAGVVLTLALAGALIWVRERARGQDDGGT
ncbi:MAG TPA: hypothetical protein VF520_05630 [Thermoleophilaceae bacterium]